MDPREAVAVPMEWDFPAPARSPSVLQFRIEKKQTKKYLQVINVKKSASIIISLRAHLTSWGRMISDFLCSVLMYFPSLGKKITFYLFLFLFLFLRAGAPFFIYYVPIVNVTISVKSCIYITPLPLL